MKKVERAKTLTAKSSEGLSEAYNAWYDEQLALREEVPMLKGQPIEIQDRLFSQMPLGKGTQFGLVVFFVDYLFLPHQTGPDRGQSVDKEGGVSAVKRRVR